MQRVLVAILLLVGVSAAARADRRAGAGGDEVVAILPFTTADRALAIYSKAAAAALAAELRGIEGVSITSVSLSESPPAGVALVIDGRIVGDQSGSAVSIELTVRDPERGIAVGTVSSRVAALAEIDALVADAGRRVRAVLAQGLAGARAWRAERDRPIRLQPTIVEGAGAASRLEPGRVGDRPGATMMVLPATGGRVGELHVDEIATHAARSLASALGFQPVSSGGTGVATHRDAAALATRAGAAGALKVHVKALDFDWLGVLTARATVRVVLTAADGEVLFDRTVRTDTVVGSRGDRHEAVVRMVCDQAMEIAAPVLRRELGAR